MLEIGLAVAHLTIVVLAAAAIGGFALGDRFAFAHRAHAWAAHIAVGILVLSYAIFALVESGHAGTSTLTVLSALCVPIALTRVVPPARRWIIARRHRARRLTTTPARAGWWLMALASTAYVMWALLGAALPAAAADELIHHLAVPRRMLDEGAGVVFVDNIYAYFPALGEMLFLWGLATGGETTARLFHTALGLCAALALFGFSRRHLTGAASWWAVAIFLTVPSVMVILPWAYVDLIFTLYALLASAALFEYFDTHLVRWAALAGVMAGGALATKYTGLPLILMLAAVLLAGHLLQRRRDLPVAAAALVAGGLAVAAPCIWRNWRLTGWPLFPFAFGPFDLRGGINWDADREALFVTLLSTYGSGAIPPAPASAWDAMTAPVLVFLGARFNDPRWYDGVVGPLFLLAPLALFGRARQQGLAWPASVATVWVLYWAIAIRQVRFLIPALPLLSFLAAAALYHWRSRILYALAGVGVAASVVIAGSRVLVSGPVPYWTGREGRDGYLARQIAGYPMYQAANRRLGPGDRLYLLNMKNYGYYLRRWWRADFVFESWRLEQVLAATATPGAVARFFDDRAVTHLLIDERATAALFTPGQRAAIAQYLSDAILLERIGERALYALPPAARRSP